MNYCCIVIMCGLFYDVDISLSIASSGNLMVYNKLERIRKSIVVA
jgi:hypothetical protein